MRLIIRLNSKGQNSAKKGSLNIRLSNSIIIKFANSKTLPEENHNHILYGNYNGY